MSIKQITAQQLQQRLRQDQDRPLLLDVREEVEFEIAQIDGSVLIPMHQIQQRSNELEKDREIVVICHHGIRSQQVAEYLVCFGYSNITNLTGGIDAWSSYCDPAVPRY